MNKTVHIRKTVTTALCVALCLVLPMAFHAVQNSGAIFCPMHIPVLLCGLVCGWQYGLVCGLIGPVLSSLLTGMPPAAILPAMLVELAVYGIVSGIMMRSIKIKNLYGKLYISLAAAMLMGRIASGISKALIFSAGSFTFKAWIGVSFVTCLPGILIHLAVIPTLVVALNKAHLMPSDGVSVI